MKYIVIYQKHNGEMIYRYNKTKPIYNKGDKTSMGWKVIDIQRLHKGKVLSTSKYSAVIDFEYQIRHFYDLFNKIDMLKLFYLILALYIIFVKF